MAALQLKGSLILFLLVSLLLLLRRGKFSWISGADSLAGGLQKSHEGGSFNEILSQGDSQSQSTRETRADYGPRRLLFVEATIDRNGTNSTEQAEEVDESCTGIKYHVGSECEFVRSRESCQSGTLIEYLQFYYCTCKDFKILGAAVLGLGLLALFFMLGNTAADYFCPSLEELSELLHLPPTIAGVTLLPLGNGAPDVFASIAAFIGAGKGQVGLNSVLGAALFVCTVVAGSVSLLVASLDKDIRVDKISFVRDICFYVLSLLVLLTINIVGRIHLPLAIAFVSIYILYGVSVGISEIFRVRVRLPKDERLVPPLRESTLDIDPCDPENSLLRPLLGAGEGESDSHPLPLWLWGSNSHIYSVHEAHHDPNRDLWGWHEEEEMKEKPQISILSFHFIYEYVIKFPLMLPRQLTIPTHQEDDWSKPNAVASAFLSPFLCTFVMFNGAYTWKPYIVAGIVSLVLGTLTLLLTDSSKPPKRFAFPWALGGFVMSVVWFYIIANELVAVLVAMGAIFEIDPSLLGLTVLAWGNSVGDMVANLAMCSTGKRESVQIAWSGCFAGPIFNTLVGIGSSLVLACWRASPSVFLIPRDPKLVWTFVFLLCGLLYSLVVLTVAKMRLCRILGLGLIGIYLGFMTLRVLNVLELVIL